VSTLILIRRFVLATAAALAGAFVAQWLLALHPLQLNNASSDELPTLLLLLVVLNLLTVVVFVTIQSRILAALLSLPRQRLVAPVTAAGPLAAMLGYVLVVHWGLTLLAPIPFALGQLSLLVWLRRAALASSLVSDDSSQR
jgi:hypothetical protein